MIVTWMVEGELFDPKNEFFITVNTNCQEKDIWRDKFILRYVGLASLFLCGLNYYISRYGNYCIC